MAHHKVFVYILACNDDSLYTGWTVDLQKRLAAHQRGTASKYTRSRTPVQLVYWEDWPTPSEAMKREWHIKSMTRLEKKNLIAQTGKKDLP
jgi:putative endonuclease